MKLSSETVNISIPEELGEEIECEVKFHIENDGIGSYEYWGAKCFDAGNDYIEVDEIIPNFADQSKEAQVAINKYIEDNFESVCENISLEIDKINQER